MINGVDLNAQMYLPSRLIDETLKAKHNVDGEKTKVKGDKGKIQGDNEC